MDSVYCFPSVFVSCFPTCMPSCGFSLLLICFALGLIYLGGVYDKYLNVIYIGYQTAFKRCLKDCSGIAT